ncbi:MAG: hypothetical protein FJY20_10785 [Bacteroidetes bacterium]|nr:hypothetical protein [Bacteroidota bacterium]
MYLTIRKIVLSAILFLCLSSVIQAQKDSTLDQRIGVAFCKEFSKIDSTKLKGDVMAGNWNWGL